MAVKILICDDVAKEAEKLALHVGKYVGQFQKDVDVSCCTKPEEILSVVESYKESDIIFLDIFMDTLNGIDIAVTMRDKGVNSKIVFVSTSQDYALEAFGVNAAQYLVKPVEYGDVEKTLDYILGRMNKNEKPVSVVTVNGVVSFMPSEFVFSETQQHYQLITLSGKGTAKVRMSCSSFFEFFKDFPEIIRIGASHIVNLKYIHRLAAKEIQLTDGSSIRVPRGTYGELKKKYFDYYSDSGVE